MKRNLILVLLLLLAKAGMAQVYTSTIVASRLNSSYRNIDNAPVDSGKNGWTGGMVVAAWTSGGIPFIWRSFIKINLPPIPTGSVVESASLSLYADPESPSGNVGYPTWGTDNAMGIYRLTSAWDTATIDWHSQPGYTTMDSVILPQSTSTSEDYKVDVTGLIKDSYTYGNYGFVFRELQESTPLNSMIFYSPYDRQDKNPTLIIKFRSTTAVSNVGQDNMTMNVYPNPATSNVNIAINNNQGTANLTVRDLAGRTQFAQQIDAGNTIVKLQVSDYARGMYLVSLQYADGSTLTKKLLLN